MIQKRNETNTSSHCHTNSRGVCPLLCPSRRVGILCCRLCVLPAPPLARLAKNGPPPFPLFCESEVSSVAPGGRPPLPERRACGRMYGVQAQTTLHTMALTGWLASAFTLSLPVARYAER